MSLPNYIRVLGVDHELNEDDTLSTQGQPGLYVFATGEIKLASGQSPEKNIEAVIHELMEVGQESFEWELEHKIMKSIGRFFMAVLLDNPDFVAHILTMCDDTEVDE